MSKGVEADWRQQSRLDWNGGEPHWDGKLPHFVLVVEETDLKTPMRLGASDEELTWMFVDSVRAKWAGHLINQADFVKPDRNMSQIGG